MMVNISTDEVTTCLKILMDHIAKGGPWPGRPVVNEVTELMRARVAGQDRGDLVKTMAAMLHVGIIATAYNDALVGVEFDGEQMAAAIINFISLDPARWSMVPGCVQSIRGIVDLAACLQ
jgi:hypothetical protein